MAKKTEDVSPAVEEALPGPAQDPEYVPTVEDRLDRAEAKIDLLMQKLRGLL